jgi:hypothetical protein
MKPGVVISLIAVALLGGGVYTSCKPAWQFDHLEQNARKAITAAELQAWAAKVLVDYPSETSFWASAMGTNFPSQLRDLAPRLGPHVFVHHYDETNQPPYVQIYWGSGFLGSSGFYLGATNFLMSGNDVHVWHPGVYFYHY